MADTSWRANPEELLEDLTWLQRLAQRLVGDPAAAEDVVQDTWLAVLKRPPSLGRPPRRWLASVARNFVFQRNRAEANRRAREERAAREEPLPSPEELAMRVECQRLLVEAVARLREPYRSTLILRYAEGLAPAEIARRQELPASSVRRRIAKGIELLRNDLDQRHGGDRLGWTRALVPLVGPRPAWLAGSASAKAAAIGGVLVMKKLVALTLVLAAGAVLFAVWTDTPIWNPLGSDRVASQPAELDAAATASEAAAQDLQPVDETARPRSRVEPTEALTWIEGSVSLSGCSADPTLEVFALARPVSYAPFARLLEEARAGTRGMELAELVLARAPVNEDGGFRLGFPSQMESGHVMLRGRNLYLPESVPVAAGAGDAALRLTPVPGTWIHGRLRAGSGDVSGVTIELSGQGDSFDPAAGVIGTGFYLEVTSAPDGSFELRGVPPLGDYDVLALPGELAAAHRPVAGPTACGEVQLAIGLDRGGSVSGRVLGPDGTPAAGAGVQGLMPGNWTGFDDVSVRRVEANEAGEFVLHAVPDGPLFLQAWLADHMESAKISVEVHEGRTFEDVLLELGRGKELRGQVRWEDGGPASGVDVDASFDRAFRMGEAALNSIRGASSATVTDETGAFVLRGLGPGPFTVRTRTTRDARAYRGRIDAVPPDGDPIELILRAPMSIRGVVERATPGTDSPRVQATRIVESPVGELGLTRHTLEIDDPDGAFEIEGVDEGLWQLSASADGLASADPVRVRVPADTEGRTVTIGIVPAAAVSGVVLSPEGRPVSGARVLVDQGIPSWMLPLMPERTPEAARTDALGHFRLAGLEPGPIALYATCPGYSDGTPLSLELLGGETLADVGLTLRRSATMTGVFYGTDGRPAAGKLVQAMNTETEDAEFTTTDVAGDFRIEDLEPGSWFVVGIQADVWEASEDGIDRQSVTEGLATSMAVLSEGETTFVVLGTRHQEQPVVVQGRVLQGAEPWSGAWLVMYPTNDAKPNETKFATIGADGSYELTLDRPGPYGAAVQQYRGLPDRTSTIDFLFDVPEVDRFSRDFEIPSGSIAGHVFGPDGEPAAAARVTLFSESRSEDGSVHQGQYTEVTTDPNGHYVLPGLVAGEYTLLVGGHRDRGTWDGGSEPEVLARVGEPSIVLDADEVLEGVDFHLPPAGSVYVGVFDEQGVPVSGATIFAHDAEGFVVDPVSHQATDDTGLCEYQGLAPGAYRFRAQVDARGSESSPLVTAGAGEDRSVELQLGPATHLWVSLEDGAGVPTPGSVQVFDENDEQTHLLLATHELETLFLQGAFSPTRSLVGRLLPGRYRVRAQAAGGQISERTLVLAGEPEEELVLRFED